MRLATLRLDDKRTAAVRIDLDTDTASEIGDFTDVGTLLAHPDWKTLATDATGPTHSLAALPNTSWATVVPAPSKIVCVGLNYRNHIREMGRELPEHPTLFAKYPEALIGPFDPIVVPKYASEALDWEGELAIVLGATARRLDPGEARRTIAGYAVLNDVTMRDYQYRTPEWFQGKTFERTTPFGPCLVTADDYDFASELRTEVDGETMQSTTTDDLVFSPETLVSYISDIFPLKPGDVIASGTPGGVGHARNPKKYLRNGSMLTTTITGIGTISSRVVVED
jgi:acylpyruvate hydrolase